MAYISISCFFISITSIIIILMWKSLIIKCFIRRYLLPFYHELSQGYYTRITSIPRSLKAINRLRTWLSNPWLAAWHSSRKTAYPANFQEFALFAVTRFSNKDDRKNAECLGINWNQYNSLSVFSSSAPRRAFFRGNGDATINDRDHFIHRSLARRGSNAMVKVNANRRREMRQAPNFSVGRM